VDYCIARGMPVAAVSGGLDFVIWHFLREKGWEGCLNLYAGRAIHTPDGIKFTFPRLHYGDSANFKEDLVRYQKARGYRVVYTGDGLSDFCAVKNTDIAFVVKGFKPSKHCREQGIPNREFEDFRTVLEALKPLVGRD